MQKGFAGVALAAVLCCAGLPVLAAGMPDYGSKNFAPGGGTPAFFSNETAAPTVRSDDWSAVDAAAGPARPAAAPVHTASARSHRHGKIAANHRGGGTRTIGKAGGKTRSSRLAAAKPAKTTRSASAARTAHPRSPAGSRSTAAAAGTRTSGHAGTSRHAAARSVQHKG